MLSFEFAASNSEQSEWCGCERSSGCGGQDRTLFFHLALREGGEGGAPSRSATGRGDALAAVICASVEVLLAVSVDRRVFFELDSIVCGRCDFGVDFGKRKLVAES